MKINLFLAVIILSFLAACKKEINIKDVGATTYFVNSALSNQQCEYIYPSADGGLVMISNTTSDSTSTEEDLVYSKYNATGMVEWIKKIPDAGSSVKINSLQDGGIILVSNNTPNRLIRFDKNGEIVFNKIFEDVLNLEFNAPIQGEDGNFYMMLKKYWPWYPDTAALFRFDNTGNHIKNGNITLYDDNFLGAIATISLFRKTTSDFYYFYGLLYNNPVNFWNNPKLFVSRFENTGASWKRKTVIIDAQNEINLNEDGLLIHALSPSNELVFLTQQIEKNRFYKGHLTKVGEALNKIWEIDIKIGTANTQPKSLRICPDGNYLIAGFCNVNGNILKQPFAIKINPEGVEIWRKIYQIPQNSIFNSGYQAEDGNCYFGGSTNGFGFGYNLTDVFKLKTDKDGIVQ